MKIENLSYFWAFVYGKGIYPLFGFVDDCPNPDYIGEPIGYVCGCGQPRGCPGVQKCAMAIEERVTISMVVNVNLN